MPREVRDIQYKYTPVDLQEGKIYEHPMDAIKEMVQNEATIYGNQYAMNNVLLPSILQEIDYLPEDKENAERLIGGFQKQIDALASEFSVNPENKDARESLYKLSRDIYNSVLTPKGELNIIRGRNAMLMQFDADNAQYKTENPEGFKVQREAFKNKLLQANSEADMGSLKRELITKPKISEEYISQGKNTFLKKYNPDTYMITEMYQVKSLAMDEANQWMSKLNWKSPKGTDYDLDSYLMQEYNEVFPLLVKDSNGNVIVNPKLNHPIDNSLGQAALDYYGDLIKIRETPNAPKGEGGGNGNGSDKSTEKPASVSVQTVQAPSMNNSESFSEGLVDLGNIDTEGSNATKKSTQVEQIIENAIYDVDSETGDIELCGDIQSIIDQYSRGNSNDRTADIFTNPSVLRYTADDNNDLNHPKTRELDNHFGTAHAQIAYDTYYNKKKQVIPAAQKNLELPWRQDKNRWIDEHKFVHYTVLGQDIIAAVPEYDSNLADLYETLYDKYTGWHYRQTPGSVTGGTWVWDTDQKGLESELEKIAPGQLNAAKKEYEKKESIKGEGVYWIYDRDKKQWEMYSNGAGNYYNDIQSKVIRKSRAKHAVVSIMNTMRGRIKNEIGKQSGIQEDVAVFTFDDNNFYEKKDNVIAGLNSLFAYEARSNWKESTKEGGVTAKNNTIDQDTWDFIQGKKYELNGVNLQHGYIVLDMTINGQLNDDGTPKRRYFWLDTKDATYENEVINLLRENATSGRLQDALLPVDQMRRIRQFTDASYSDTRIDDKGKTRGLKKSFYVDKRSESIYNITTPTMYDKDGNFINGCWRIDYNYSGWDDAGHKIKCSYYVYDENGKLKPWLSDRDDGQNYHKGRQFVYYFNDEFDYADGFSRLSEFEMQTSFQTHKDGVLNKNYQDLMARQLRGAGFAFDNAQAYYEFKKKYPKNTNEYKAYVNSLNALQQMYMGVLDYLENNNNQFPPNFDCSQFVNSLCGTGKQNPSTGIWNNSRVWANELEKGSFESNGKQFDCVGKYDYSNKNKKQVYDNIAKNIEEYDKWYVIVYDRGRDTQNHMAMVMKSKDDDGNDILRYAQYSQTTVDKQTRPTSGFNIGIFDENTIEKLTGIKKVYIAKRVK